MKTVVSAFLLLASVTTFNASASVTEIGDSSGSSYESNLVVENTALKGVNGNIGISPAGHLTELPVPAAFWLLGTALISFIAVSRRTKLS